MNHDNMWTPYFKPTTSRHDSGFRCFECGYLVMGFDKKAAKKVIVGTNADNISSHSLGFMGPAVGFQMDLLLDGNIRVFSHKTRLWWHIPGWSDASITDKEDGYMCNDDFINKLYERQKNEVAK